jgi:peptide chain release factor subunit 1
MTVVPKQFIAVDDEAVIHPLALELDEYEAIGVIMIDASCTRILITAGQIIEDVDSLCTKIHHLSKVGGWSQMRYQRRRQKQIHHFTKDVLEKATAVFSESGVRRIIIAGRDRMITALEQELPKAWAEKVIAKVRWDLNEPGREFVKKIKPMLEQAERDQEKVLVDQLVRELRRGELGVAGFDATMKALSMAQVDILFVSKGIDARTCEKLVSLAQSTGAYVEFVPVDNKTLAALGNVGGLLRYKI